MLQAGALATAAHWRLCAAAHESGLVANILGDSNSATNTVGCGWGADHRRAYVVEVHASVCEVGLGRTDTVEAQPHLRRVGHERVPDHSATIRAITRASQHPSQLQHHHQRRRHRQQYQSPYQHESVARPTITTQLPRRHPDSKAFAVPRPVARLTCMGSSCLRFGAFFVARLPKRARA